MNKTIHLVSDSLQKIVVKSVLKVFRVKEPVRVCKPGGKIPCDEDDTLVVWHGGDAGSMLLLYYLCKVVPGDLYHIDYSHADRYAELGGSLVLIGERTIARGRFVGSQVLVPEDVKKEAAAHWDRLSQDLNKPLKLKGEDGVIRSYPKDYLDDWLLGIMKRSLQENDIVTIPLVVGFATGMMARANDDVLTTAFFERRLSKLARTRNFLKDGQIIDDGSFESVDNSWLDDDSNEWASYRRWKEQKSQ